MQPLNNGPRHKRHKQALHLEPARLVVSARSGRVLRRSDQVDRALEWQRRANLGKQLMRQITLAPRIDALAESVMHDMAAYLSCAIRSRRPKNFAGC